MSQVTHLIKLFFDVFTFYYNCLAQSQHPIKLQFTLTRVLLYLLNDYILSL